MVNIRALFLLGIACAAVVAAAELSGNVVDAQGGEALARVRIQLLPAASARQAVTDPRGRFAFSDLEAGKYTLQVETVGYRMLRQEVDLAADGTEVRIVLSPETFRRTDSVEVRADVFAPVATSSPVEQTLLGSELRSLGTVLLDDPVRALHNLPGVTANNDFYAQFSVRGAPFNRIGFYLDDILLHAPFHSVQGVSDAGSQSILNTDMLESLALLPQAFPSSYGDRTGAVVDVRTRDGNRTKRNYRATINLASVTGMTEGPIGRRTSYMASARKSYLQNLASQLSADSALAIGFFDYQAKLTTELTSRQTVTLQVIDGTTLIDRSNVRARSGVNAIIFARYRPTILKTGWRWTPSSSLVATAAAAWMRERYDNTNRDDARLGNGLYGEWSSHGAVSWQPNRRYKLDAGGTARRLRDNGFSLTFLNTSTNIRTRDQYAGNAVRSGAFVEQTLTLPSLRVSLGVRTDHHSLLPDTTTATPHASAVVRLTRATDLHLGWGQYVQYPEVWMLTTPAGGRRLQPERSNHYTASIEQRLGSQTRLRVEAFTRDDRDQITRPLYDPRIQNGRVFVPADTRLYNSVRGYARGAQIVLQSRTANRITGWVGYTLLYARQRDGIERQEYRALDEQRHTLNTWLSYRIRPSLSLSATWNLGSGTPIPGFVRRDGDRLYQLVASRNGSTLGRYQRLDLRAGKSFTRDRWKFTLYGELINAMNNKNFRVNSFDGVDARTGRAFVSTLRVFPILPSFGLMLEF